VQTWVASQFGSLDNFGDLKVFAHPSNFLIGSAFSLATKVIGKRVAQAGGGVGHVSYVINDGIFGAFGRLLHDDDVALEPRPMNCADDADAAGKTCDVFGPSGHDMDQVPFLPSYKYL
jgi:hypothetical protein